MPTNDEKLKALYSGVSKDYNIGTYDEFKVKMESPEKRKAFYEGVGAEYNLGDYPTFESKLGYGQPEVKKKDLQSVISPFKDGRTGTKPISPSESVSTSPSEWGPVIGTTEIKEGEVINPLVEAPEPEGIPMEKGPTIPPTEEEEEGYLWDEFLKAGAAQAAISINKAPGVMYDLLAMPQNAFEDLTGLNTGTSWQEFKDYWGYSDDLPAIEYVLKESQKKINAKYDKPITDYISEGKYSDALSLLGGSVLQSAPMTLSIILTRGAGVGAGTTTVATGMVMAGGEIDEIRENNPEMSTNEQTALAFNKGMMEGIFEGNLGVSKLGTIAGKVFKESGEEAAKKIAKDGFREVYGPIMKRYIGIGAEEALSEGATQFSQNALDIVSGNKPDLDLMDGVLDATLVGLGSAVTYSGAPATKEIINASKGRKIFNDLQGKQSEIAQALENEQVSPEAKDALANMSKEVNEQMADEYAKVRQDFNNLSPEQQAEALRVGQQLQEAETAASDPNVPEGLKKDLEAKRDQLEETLDNIYKPKEEAKPEVVAETTEANELKESENLNASEERVKETTEQDVSESVDADGIKTAIEEVISGAATKYIKAGGRTIRISNHSANPDRIGDNDISIVIPSANKEAEPEAGTSSMGVNKKSFKSIPNQIFLNEEGNPTENWETIEDVLEYFDFNLSKKPEEINISEERVKEITEQGEEEKVVLYRGQQKGRVYDKPNEGAIFFSPDKNYVSNYGDEIVEAIAPAKIFDIREGESHSILRNWVEGKISEIENSEKYDDLPPSVKTHVKDARRSIKKNAPRETASAMTSIGMAKVGGFEKYVVGKAEKDFMRDFGIDAMYQFESLRENDEVMSVAFREMPDVSKKPEEINASEQPVESVNISDEVYDRFVDSGEVPAEIVTAIAEKVKNKTPLSDRENAIFTDKTSEINTIISNEKINEEGRTQEGLLTPEGEAEVSPSIEKGSKVRFKTGTLEYDGEVTEVRPDGKYRIEFKVGGGKGEKTFAIVKPENIISNKTSNNFDKKEKKPNVAESMNDKENNDMDDRALLEAVGKKGFDLIRKVEGFGEAVSRSRVIENAKKISQIDKKEGLPLESIAEAVHYESGYADDWADLRNAIDKGGVRMNIESVERILQSGINLPSDIMVKYNEFKSDGIDNTKYKRTQAPLKKGADYPVVSSKKGKFKIIQNSDKSKKPYFKEVTGQSVSFPNYPDLEAFVYKDKDGWTVTESRTGLSFGQAHKTPQLAADAAYETLLYQQSFNKDYASIYEIVDGNIEKLGVGKKYGIKDKHVPSDNEKISILEDRITQLEAEIESEKKSHARYGSIAPTSIEESIIKHVKERIKEIKSDQDQRAQAVGYDNKHQALNSAKKNAKAEAETLEEVTDDQLKEAAEKSETVKSKKIKEAATALANKIREGKIAKPGAFQTQTPGSIVWDAALETVAKTIEATGSVAQAVADGLKTIKDSDWYKGLSKEKQKEAEDAFSQAFEEPRMASVKNAATDQAREDFGLEPAKPRKGMTDAELKEAARKAIEADPNAVFDVMDKVSEGIPISGVEEVMITNFLAGKQAEVRAIDEKVEANPQMSTAQFEKLMKDRDSAIDDLNKGIEAAERAGTIASDALRARKIMMQEDYSLSGMMIRKRKAKGSQLTKTELDNLAKKHEELQAAEEAWKKKFEKLQEENEKLKAQEGFKKIRREADREFRSKERGNTKEAIKKEREDLLAQFDKALRKSRGELGSFNIKAVPELAAITTKLVKTYLKEGVVNLEDIIDKIHTDLQNYAEDITKRDIRDAISGYGQDKRKTRPQLQKDLDVLKAEARLISQIEDAEQGIERGNPDKRGERVEKLEALRNQLESLRKIHGLGRHSDDTKLSAYKARVKTQITALQEKISKGDYSKEKPKELGLDEEAKALRDKYQKTKYEFDVALEKDKLARRTAKQKLIDGIISGLSLPTTLKSSFDFSMPLRQGLIPTIRGLVASKDGRKTVGEASANMFKHWYSKGQYDRWLFDLRESEGYELMKKSDLAVEDYDSPKVAARNEMFMSKLAKKIPLVSASSRAAVAYLNKLRVDAFAAGAEAYQRLGITFQNNPESFKALAKYINITTGRGQFTNQKADSILTALSFVLFSPRFWASRLQFLLGYPLYMTGSNSYIRKMYSKDLTMFLAFQSLLYGLWQIYGYFMDDDDDEADNVTFELDPRSTDFGKLREGDTRIDLWGGLQQNIRFMAQMMRGQKKVYGSDEIVEFNEDRYGPTWESEGIRFFRGKTSPIISFAWDMAAGRDMFGKPTNIKDELIELFEPMIWNSAVEAYREGGFKSMTMTTALSMFGAGVQTYSTYNFLDKEVDTDLIQLLAKKKTGIQDPTQELEMADKETGKLRKMTGSEYEKFYDAWTTYMKAVMRSNKTELEGMKPEDFKKSMDKYRRDARDYGEEVTSGVPNGIETIRAKGVTHKLTPEQVKERIGYVNQYLEAYTPAVRSKITKAYIDAGLSPEAAEIVVHEAIYKEALQYSRKAMLQ